MLAEIKDYASRITAGKEKETKILQQLSSFGIKLAPASVNEDKDDKIDAWIVKPDGKHSLQIKFRENGDDIIFEVMRDIDKNMPGRDSVSKAEFYLVVNRLGVGRLFLTAPIKKIATQLHGITNGLTNTGKTRWHGIGWELKITVDKANGSRKMMAYFNPGKFDCLGEWNFDL